MNQRLSRLKSIPLLALIVALSSCDSGSTEDTLVTSGIIVANQGNFTEGSGSVTVYNPASGNASTLADNFGSIVQSVFLTGDSLYVMANTANRVDVFNLETGNRLAQISGVVNPRYMITNGSDTGYITNLSDDPGGFTGGSVTVIDLATHSVVDTIGVGDNPEGLLAVGPRLFVANTGFGEGSTISVIDQVNAVVVGNLNMNCHGPQFLAVDAEVEVFAACSGATLYDENFNPVEELDGEIVVFDGATFDEVERIEIDGKIQTLFSAGVSIFHSPETEEIFYVQDANTIGRFNTATNSVINEISISGDPIGAIAYDHVDDKLYLGRVPGFDVSGSVTIHELDGTQTGSFSAGIAPSQIILARELE